MAGVSIAPQGSGSQAPDRDNNRMLDPCDGYEDVCGGASQPVASSRPSESSARGWVRRAFASSRGRRSSGEQPARAPGSQLFWEAHHLGMPAENGAEDAEGKYNDSLFGRIARSKVFEYTTIVVIVLNAICIGWDTDYSARIGKDDNLFKGPVYFAIFECFFCAYFSAEIVIRFLAYRVKWRCVLDAWFVFDSILVTMMIVETLILPFTNGGGPLAQLSLLRLLRLLRITRMAKLMRAFPQLMLIVKGIAAATKAVFWTGFLLVIVTYTWAIFFTNEYHQGFASDETVAEWAEEPELDDPVKYGMDFFGSMGKSMLSLLVMGTILDDVTACTDAIRRSQNMWMLLAFIVYILLNSFTMMNMLVGILVDVVGNTAEEEKTRLLEEGVREAILRIFEQMDKDRSGSISREEFWKMKRDKTVMAALQELDVKEKEFDMYVALLFQPDEDGNTPPLDFRRLLDCILRLRPGTSVNALDFASFKQSLLKSHDALRDRVIRIERLCSTLANGGDVVANPPPPSPMTSPRRINIDMLADLEQASSADIVGELQRRMGMVNIEETGVPWSMLDEELRGRVKSAETCHTLGVPQAEPEWSTEILTC